MQSSNTGSRPKGIGSILKKPKSLKAEWTFHHRIDGELKQAHLLFGYIEN